MLKGVRYDFISYRFEFSETWSQKCPQIQDFGVAAWFRLYSVLAKQKIFRLQ